MSPEAFDAGRAKLAKADMFPRFRADGPGVPLAQAQLAGDETLLVFARGGIDVGLIRRQMVFYHCAQGELNKQPWIVSF